MKNSTVPSDERSLGQKCPRDDTPTDEADDISKPAMKFSPFLCCTISGNRMPPNVFLLPDSETILFTGEGDTIRVVAISHPHAKQVAVLQNAALTGRAMEVMTKSIGSSCRRKSLPYLITERRIPGRILVTGFELSIFNTGDWALDSVVDYWQLSGEDFINEAQLELSPCGAKIGFSGSSSGNEMILRVYDIPTKRVTHHFITSCPHLKWIWTPDDCIRTTVRFLRGLLEAPHGCGY